jgi:tetratricopeptide (TPR) repeat protein
VNRGGALASALLVATCVHAAAGAAAAESFADCDAAVASAPSSYEAYFCYYRVAVRDATWTRAAALLDRLADRHPGSGWPLLVRGFVARAGPEETARAAAFYEQALARLARQGESRGEVIARTNLHTLRFEAGDAAAAAEHVARALQAAQAGGDREALARASVLEAKHLVSMGRELGKAHRSLRSAYEGVFPQGPFGVQQLVLELLAHVAFQLRRYDEAVAHSQRLLALKEQHGNLDSVAALRYNMANARLVQNEARPQPGSQPELREQLEEVLRVAVQEGAPVTRARAHALLGDLWSEEAPDKAQEHYTRCLDLTRRQEARTAEMHCLWAQAKHLASRRPSEAERVIRRAARIAVAAENDLWATYVWQAQLRTVWETRSPTAAGEESMALLEAIERLRRAQADAATRMGVFANWTADYYWLVGRLLGADPQQTGRAFDVSERMRARVLLERLDDDGISGPPPAGPEQRDLAETRARIAGVQRELLDPSLAGDRRSSLLTELERLELDEATLATPLSGTGGDPRRTTLSDVRARLEPHEAMLVFLVGLDQDLYGRPAGGSWVFVITPGGVEVRGIPDRLHLEAAVPVFNGLVERRDGSEDVAAVALYAQLLGDAVGLLGPEIRRLVVIPDGILHELPFAALRPTPEADPLGGRYELAVAPSATLWARWTSPARVAPPVAALVVAAPDLPARAPGVALERGGVLAHAPALPPLAYAGREGDRVRRAVGGASELLVGPAAAETALKAADLRRFGLLHLAAHALADDEYPDRSAVLLAPGSDSEDGLLQPREISMLDLEGRAVVLSACHTAAGRVVSGEGVLSLARAFFEAGARTIVAGHRALRDDETEKLMRWFYAEAARGRSLGGALHAARRRAMAEGLPAAAWSGVFLMGDPDFSWPPRSQEWPWVWAAAGVILLALALSALRRARRSFLGPSAS